MALLTLKQPSPDAPPPPQNRFGLVLDSIQDSLDALARLDIDAYQHSDVGTGEEATPIGKCRDRIWNLYRQIQADASKIQHALKPQHPPSTEVRGLTTPNPTPNLYGRKTSNLCFASCKAMESKAQPDSTANPPDAGLEATERDPQAVSTAKLPDAIVEATERDPQPESDTDSSSNKPARPRRVPRWNPTNPKARAKARAKAKADKLESIVPSVPEQTDTAMAEARMPAPASKTAPGVVVPPVDATCLKVWNRLMGMETIKRARKLIQMFRTEDSTSPMHNRSEPDPIAYFGSAIEMMDRKTTIGRLRIMFHKVELHRLNQSFTIPGSKGSIGGTVDRIAELGSISKRTAQAYIATGKVSDTLCIGHCGLLVGLPLGDEDQDWDQNDPLRACDIKITAARTLPPLVAQIDNPDIRRMCAMGKNVLDVIIYGRSASPELVSLMSNKDIELQEALALYEGKECTCTAMNLGNGE